MLGPVKFQSTVSIFVRKGSCDAEINLNNYHIEAPCLVTIRASQIMQKKNVSPDFDASFVVLSQRLSDHVLMLLNDANVFSLSSRYPIIHLDQDIADEFEVFYQRMMELKEEALNPYLYQSILYAITSFFYKVAHRCFPDVTKEEYNNQVRLPELFIDLVQQNFREQRFLPFYADKLGVTTRHLARTVKKSTGYTAGNWIERYVILEAKVLLKSTNMSIQQVSEELNFPSQSFFGKYFKKNTGFSPKNFRNNG